MQLRQWCRSRYVLLVFLAVTGLSACTLAWLGWLLWRQDATVEAQLRRERLEDTADRAVAVMQRGLAELDAQLGPAPDRSALPPDVTVLLVGRTQIMVQSGPGLIYYPVAQRLPEASPPLFREAELLEFAAAHLPEALRAYERLAKSNDAAIRAGALTRVARVARKLGQAAVAEQAYGALREIRAGAGGLPAGIIAHMGLATLMSEARRVSEFRKEAESLDAELRVGRWQLSKEQYDLYRADVDSWLGKQPQTDPGGLARAEAFDRVWRLATAESAVRGCITHARGAPALAVWRRDAETLYVVVGGPQYLSALTQQAGHEPTAHLALTDLEGQVLLGAAAARDVAVRTAATTGLPWTVHVASALPGQSRSSRRGLLVGIFAVLIGVTIAGAYFIERAISRELRVALLQSDFVAAVSHEFRSPLTSLGQIAEMLVRDRFPTEALRRRSYDVLARETDRLRQLVEGLLDFGRFENPTESYRFEAIDVVALARCMVEEFQDRVSTQGFAIELAAPDRAALVRADREALSRAILNLLDNAVKYSPECRKIWVSVEQESDRISITVVDRGLGIPTHEQGDVFNKFVRGSQSKAMRIKGTGIGLATVRSIAHAHGGEVLLASEPGKGSRFTMVLRGAGGAL